MQLSFSDAFFYDSNSINNIGLICIFFVSLSRSMFFVCSYDGSSCTNGNGLSGNEAPSRSRNPVSYHHNKNSANEAGGSGIHWRTSSVGSASSSDYKARASSTSAATSKNASALQQQKMTDLNITRGHSPHFSPSRNNGMLHRRHQSPSVQIF